MKAYSWAYDHGRDLLYFAVENHICEPDFQLWGALYHLGEIRDGRRDPRTGPRLVSFFEMYGRAPTKKSASYLDQIERAAMPPYFKSLSTSKQKKLVNEFYVRDSATHERDPEVASCRN
jgi:hypothetical protein